MSNEPPIAAAAAHALEDRAEHAWDAFTRHLPHHHDQAPTTEEPMTHTPEPTPQHAPPLDAAQAALAEAATHLRTITANPLVQQLATEGLGHRLAPGEITVVLDLVRGWEALHNTIKDTAAAPAPAPLT